MPPLPTILYDAQVGSGGPLPLASVTDLFDWAMSVGGGTEAAEEQGDAPASGVPGSSQPASLLNPAALPPETLLIGGVAVALMLAVLSHRIALGQGERGRWLLITCCVGAALAAVWGFDRRSGQQSEVASNAYEALELPARAIETPIEQDEAPISGPHFPRYEPAALRELEERLKSEIGGLSKSQSDIQSALDSIYSALDDRDAGRDRAQMALADRVDDDLQEVRREMEALRKLQQPAKTNVTAYPYTGQGVSSWDSPGAVGTPSAFGLGGTPTVVESAFAGAPQQHCSCVSAKPTIRGPITASGWGGAGPVAGVPVQPWQPQQRVYLRPSYGFTPVTAPQVIPYVPLAVPPY